MAYQEISNIYLPSNLDSVDVHASLASNFQIISNDIISKGVSVTLFGAVGNYSYTNRTGTDNYLAFQKALNVARDKGSATVFVPNGVYKVAQELLIYQNTKLILAPNAVIVREHAGYMLKNGYKKGDSQGTANSWGAYNGNGNIEIVGGTWDSNGNYQRLKASCFHFGHAEDVTLTDVTIKNVFNSHGVEFNACKNVRVSACKFLGFVLAPLGEYNEAIQLDIARHGETIMGLDDGTPCRNVWVEHCVCDKSGDLGTGYWGRFMGSHSAVNGKPQENINITNNTIIGTLTWAIRAYAWNHTHISSNTIIDCNMGINIRCNINDGVDSVNPDGTDSKTAMESVSHEITGNNIRGGMEGGRAIEIYGDSTNARVKSVTVTGNTIRCNKSVAASAGILLSATEDVSVSGNTIYGMGTDGIKLQKQCYNTTINGNVIQYVDGAGVFISESCHYITVTGNMIKFCGTNGIYATDMEMANLTGNNITGVNGKGAADNTYNFIRLTSGVVRATISANMIRNLGSYTVTTTGVYITNACDYINMTGNVFQGFKVTNNAPNKVDVGNI